MTDTPATRPPHAPTATRTPGPGTGPAPGTANPAQGSTEPREETPDECTGCGRDDGPMYLDPRPRHPRDPQAQYCRDCASDLFDLGEEEPDHV